MAFNKRNNEQAETTLAGVLNVPDTDILVVQPKNCRVLFMNSAAQKRLHGQERNSDTCMDGYAQHFNGMCNVCPLGNGDGKLPQEPVTFETKSTEGQIFSVTTHPVQWLDGKTAAAFYLRNMDAEHKAREKLYNLAYIDHLTGVPNRQKFRESFEEIQEEIEIGKTCGIVSIFDLDNFKGVNDTYGHNTGDVLLKRLTEHFSQDPAFTGHLYRLGGDEFVLFYAEKAGRLSSPQEYIKYYTELLQGALLAYTMPNIELSCTISMGAAFFPTHGSTVSDLLRKADIALYQAKSAGRNRLVVFEDRYDTAKKFKDLYINIQPILTANGLTYGYELVDRGNEDAGEDGTVNLTDLDRTMDALGLGDIQNSSLYFIPFSNQLLSDTVLKNLPKGKFIIQITLPDTLSAKQLTLYKSLRGAGYMLALVGIHTADVPANLLDLVSYCKFMPGSLDPSEQRAFIARHADKKFIAAGINSAKALEAASGRGFKLFEGYFFDQAPPVVKKTKDIDPMKANYLRLLKMTCADDYVDFQEISAIISADVALSYKLLRLLNSAAIGLRNQVSSIEMAVAYLGEDSLKKWIAMLALRGIASDKPLELVRLSLIRAQFGENLAPFYRPPRNPKHVFLLGMFSLLNIALEQTQEQMLGEIPVAKDIRDSLLTKTGAYSDMLPFFVNYEYANWDEISRYTEEKRLSAKLVSDAYLSAVKWYNQLAND